MDKNRKTIELLNDEDYTLDLDLNNKAKGSLRLMSYTYPLVWFFQSKELQTEPLRI